MSNTTFNNTVFTGRTIRRMKRKEEKPKHPSAERLYSAAKEMRGVEGKSNVARLLDETPQTLNNWEKRGVSVEGALKAQRIIHCDANWVLSALGSMRPTIVEVAATPEKGAVFMRLSEADLALIDDFNIMQDPDRDALAAEIKKKADESRSFVERVLARSGLKTTSRLARAPGDVVRASISVKQRLLDLRPGKH